MAKNFELIPGERSNWEVVFFLLIDKMVPFLKPDAVINRHELVSTAGMEFLCGLLGEIVYGTEKALEERLQGTINDMVKKKFILTDGSGQYTLTEKGHKRLIEIREKYDPEWKKPLGAIGKALKALELIPDNKIRKEVLRNWHNIEKSQKKKE